MPSPILFKGAGPANYEKYSGESVLEPYAIDLRDRIRNQSVRNVLELACGTGRVTRHLATLIPAYGTLTATDISDDMMKVAKTIVTDPRVRWQIADAQELPFGDTQFDHVICQYGVMFFTDRLKAFQEVFRVLLPEGTFLFNVWDTFESNPRPRMILRVLRECFGEVPEKLKLPHSFHDKGEIERVLRESGFKRCRIEVVNKAARYGSVEDIINAFVTGSLSADFLKEQPEREQQDFKERLRRDLIAEYGEQGITIPMQALVCETRKS
jgi:ubiquinone/menaquinone biosynthesis C-methylase UbiE